MKKQDVYQAAFRSRPDVVILAAEKDELKLAAAHRKRKEVSGMVDGKELERMAKADICGRDPAVLPDLLEVQLCGESAAERFAGFLGQVKNPYCFRVGDTPVKVLFSGGEPLENKIKSHFIALKG